MTSSLVGSEMCIRDSQRLVKAVRHLEVVIGILNPTHTWVVVPPSSGTVSYTHLTLPTICSV
eukprot:4630357-Prorocentrum_lima.AAC.1